MGSQRYNITDIARLAGVSPATVSRALNAHPYVTQEVHDKVFTVMHQLGYDPRPRLSRKRLAILLNDRNMLALNSYGSSMLFQLMCICERHDIAVQMLGTSSLELLSEYFLKVAITFQEFLTPDDLTRCPYTQFICINSQLSGAFAVRSDEAQGISLALEELWGKGHRSIALILPTETKNQSGLGRHEAFCRLYGELSGGDVLSHVCYLGDTPVENIARLFMRVNPDSLIVGGEDMSFRVNYALSLLGKRVPEDVSLVSYENIFASALMVPPHTTVAQNVELLASEAVRLALQCLEGASPADDEIVVPNKLIVRDSVCQLSVIP